MQPGLKWEAIAQSPVPKPTGVDTIYSLRISQSSRAIGFRNGGTMVLIWFSPDHDATYRIH